MSIFLFKLSEIILSVPDSTKIIPDFIVTGKDRAVLRLLVTSLALLKFEPDINIILSSVRLESK